MYWDHSLHYPEEWKDCLRSLQGRGQNQYLYRPNLKFQNTLRRAPSLTRRLRILTGAWGKALQENPSFNSVLNIPIFFALKLRPKSIIDLSGIPFSRIDIFPFLIYKSSLGRRKSEPGLEKMGIHTGFTSINQLRYG